MGISSGLAPQISRTPSPKSTKTPSKSQNTLKGISDDCVDVAADVDADADDADDDNEANSFDFLTNRGKKGTVPILWRLLMVVHESQNTKKRERTKKTSDRCCI